VKVVDTPIVDTRLVLNWTPSSTTCSSSHWLPQSAPQLPLVTLETLCWNRIHVLSNLGSLTGVYSRISSYPKKVGVTFGYTHLTFDLIPPSPLSSCPKKVGVTFGYTHLTFDLIPPSPLGKCLIRVPKKLISTSKSVYVSVSNETVL
jgi:hypothetical protein